MKRLFFNKLQLQSIDSIFKNISKKRREMFLCYIVNDYFTQELYNNIFNEINIKINELPPEVYIKKGIYLIDDKYHHITPESYIESLIEIYEIYNKQTKYDCYRK